MTEVQENPRISLDDAASIMSMILSEIDELDPSSEERVIENYMNAGNSLVNSIDRRKHVLKEAESKIELAKKMKEGLDEQIKKYRKVHESIVESTKRIVESHPSITFRDSLGKKVFVTQNPSPRLECTLDTKTVTYHNALSQDDYFFLVSNGYEKYVTDKTIKVLDTNIVKEDLIQDECPGIEFAKLVKGSQLRGMK